MLGRAVVYDEVAEAIASSERVVCRFFKDFVRRWSRTKYDEWVCAPRTADEFWKNEAAYRVAGFPGCGWSTDCVHLAWDRCPHVQRNAHVGKEGFPSLVFQVTFNHKRKILATTCGMPGAVNDKVRSYGYMPVFAAHFTNLTAGAWYCFHVLQQTIARLDPFLTEVRDGVILSDIKYDVYDKDGGKHVMSGAWGLVDGGYHRWLTMFGPFLAFNERDALWSAWSASLRKDSEDGFGILKGMFSSFFFVRGLYCLSMHRMHL